MKDYTKISLIELKELCVKGNKKALIEWKRRWITPWPSLGGQIKVKKDR